MTHPYLQDEEHLRAFQQLTSRPTGSVRKWEQMLKWKPGRLQRFLANLIAKGLAEVEACHKHSIFHPLVTVAGRSVAMRSVAVPKQGTARAKNNLASGDCRGKCEQPGGELLIATMNESLARYNSYLPVRNDNWGSHRAARRWLVDAKIPLEDAVKLIRLGAECFDLDRAPGKEFPETIAYFSRFVMTRWRAVLRDRDQLPLMPQMDMEVVRATEYKAEPGGAVTDETAGKVMRELRDLLPQPKRRA